MSDLIEIINISPMQCFVNDLSDDTSYIQSPDNDKDKNDIYYFENFQDNYISHISYSDSIQDNDTSIIQSFDNLQDDDTSIIQSFDNLQDNDTSIIQSADNLLDDDTSIIQSFDNLQDNDTSIIQSADNLQDDDTSVIQSFDNLQDNDTSIIQSADNLQDGDTSIIQSFDNLQDDDTSVIQSSDNLQDDDTSVIQSSDNPQDDDTSAIQSSDSVKDNTEINIPCFDNRYRDELIQPSSCASVDSKSLIPYPNSPETPNGISTGVIIKTPIVLAQLKVQFYINSIVQLPEPALEIKDIKKRLKITSCTLLQPTNVLFIKGFIRKNIDYSIRTCSNIEGVCGDIRHCSVDTPFECTTIVNFFRSPEPPGINTRQEFGYLTEKELPNSNLTEKDRLISEDLSGFHQISEEFFNELPFCELLSSKIVEFDQFISPNPPSDINLALEERSFREIEEKMVIELRLEILQKQRVTIPPISTNSIDEDIVNTVI